MSIRVPEVFANIQTFDKAEIVRNVEDLDKLSFPFFPHAAQASQSALSY